MKESRQKFNSWLLTFGVILVAIIYFEEPLLEILEKVYETWQNFSK